MDALTRSQPELDHPSAFAWFSLSSGVLSMLLLLATLKPLPHDAGGQLSYVADHQAFVIFAAVVDLGWAVCAVPFVVTLGQILRTKSASFAFAAIILSVSGILLLGFVIFARIGAFLSILASSVPPRGEEASYQAAIWGHLFFYLSDPGLMTWGLGQFLFGWLAWKSQVVPNWLALVGMLGGLAGLLTLAVYESPVLALAQLGSFAIWGLVTSRVLFRSNILVSRTDAITTSASGRPA